MTNKSYLQADDNTDVEDEIADAIDRRINSMGRTYEVNRIKNNFEAYCVDNQLRTVTCTQTAVQKSLCFGIAYAYFSIETYRNKTLHGLINLLHGTSYRAINTRYLEVMKLRNQELVDWTSTIFQNENILCPMFFMEKYLWGDDHHSEITYEYLSEMNYHLKEYLDDLSFDKCKSWQEDLRRSCCGCDVDGSVDLLCTAVEGSYEDGVCECRTDVEIEDDKCGECKDGYYQFPDCLPCGCNAAGTGTGTDVCNKTTGICSCEASAYWTGDKCNTCLDGYYLVNDVSDGYYCAGM